VGKRGNISVYKSVLLTAKITLEFYKISDPKNFHLKPEFSRHSDSEILTGLGLHEPIANLIGMVSQQQN
jgi:hypothetical protein